VRLRLAIGTSSPALLLEELPLGWHVATESSIVGNDLPKVIVVGIPSAALSSGRDVPSLQI
jgi:hypothetical protein